MRLKSVERQVQNIVIAPDNGEPARCMVQVELGHNICLAYPRYDIQLFVPTEFAGLLEADLPLNITLEQNGN